MKIFSHNKQHLVILEKNEELIESLNSLIKHNPTIKSAWIYGIGAANKATISFFDPTQQKYIDKVIHEDIEILNLQGNLSFVEDKQPQWHIHGTFSGKDYSAFGGHIQSLTIGLTCEILIQELPFLITREFDTNIGIHILTEKK